MEKVSENKCFGGKQLRFIHASASLKCDMHFSLYLPPQAESTSVPLLYWLSGLTCTDENFITKAGAQRYAAEAGLAILAPDTSPRGKDIPDAPDTAYDLGLGAGFYLNATQTPWVTHYQMYDYIVEELPRLIHSRFPVDHNRVGISGHSMGGHGALTIALKNPKRFHSASAFAPICAPMHCPWGQKALKNYLGDDPESWKTYDTCELIKEAKEKLPILVDQGESDPFLKEQLKTERLISASTDAEFPITIRMQPGYDHSYFFISSFIGEHIQFHQSHLVSG